MTLNSIGDQARAFALQTASNRLKTTLATLSDELASGEVADLGQRLQGNTQILAGMERRIQAIARMNQSAVEAATLTRGMQDVLGAVQGQTNALGLSLVVEPFNETESLLALRASEVGDAFAATVARFNHSVGGRFVFSGLNTDAPALADPETILSALDGVTAGLTTAADVAQAVSDWFDAPPGMGGFLDTAYRGTIGRAQSIPVAEAEAIGIATSAATPALREVLKGLATAAMVDRGALPGQHQARRDLMQRGGQILVNNNSVLLGEMGRIGLTQQIIARAQTENSAALGTLQIARNELRAADPYETAGALEQVQSQLSALYTVTARLSSLKLVEYLR